LTSEAGTNEGTRRPLLRRYPPDRLALVLFGLVFFGYVGVRAARVAITFDEVQSFYYYIRKGFLALFKFDQANNHFLNTFLTWLATRIAGTGEFALRIPNLLAYALYLVFCGRILTRFAPRLIAVCGFVVLNANPYLLDFFSISRGYGLALGILIPALFYLLRFIEETRDGSPRASRSLTAALAIAGAAVLANFTILIVYVSLVIVAGAVLIFSSKRRVPTTRPDGSTRKSGILIVGAAWGVLAAFLNFRAFSYDLVLYPRMFEPVTVRIVGLTPEEQKSTEVFGLDQDKEDITMSFKDGLWAPPYPSCTTAIVLRIPGNLLDKVEDVEVRIGPKTFSDRERLWQVRSGPHNQPQVDFTLRNAISLPRPDVAQIRNAINWKGRAAFNAALFRSMAWLAAAFAGLIGFGTLGRLLIRRWRLLDLEPFLPVWRITLALAAVAAGPIFLLQRKGEFYIGGYSGIMNDTFLSLVNLSLYGRRIAGPELAPWILAGFGLAVVLLFAGAWPKRLKTPGPGLFAGLVFGTVLLLTTAAVLLQHTFFRTPYLSGRSALLFVPMTLLFIVFAFASADAVKGLRLGTRALLVALTAICLVHFAKTANTRITFDWRLDADHKAVVADLERLHRERPPADATIHLGIDFNFYPGMVYLKERRGLTWLQVEVVPPVRPEDYYYVPGPYDESRMVLVKQYPTGNILVQAK